MKRLKFVPTVSDWSVCWNSDSAVTANAYLVCETRLKVFRSTSFNKLLTATYARFRTLSTLTQSVVPGKEPGFPFRRA
jgi:hypothetical protein